MPRRSANRSRSQPSAPPAGPAEARGAAAALARADEDELTQGDPAPSPRARPSSESARAPSAPTTPAIERGRTVPLPRVPAYRRHRPSGRAVVTIAGKDHYLGAHGSEASREAYDRLIAEWLSRGRPRAQAQPGDTLTVAALILAYWRYVKSVYPPRSARGSVLPTLRRLRRLYGTLEAARFGPRCLRALQEALVRERDEHDRALSRRYINRSIGWVKRCFKWAVAEELLAPSVLQALQAVEPLRMGRTAAPETEPVGPVSDAHIAATLPHLPAVIADMVRVQRLTGMRPGELCDLRACELDLSRDVWLFTPRRHKNAHRGAVRAIPIGPQAQSILAAYLPRKTDAILFSPAESQRRRYAAMRAARGTPLTPSQRERDRRRARTRFSGLRDRYTPQAYALAIWRACDRASIDRWSPNRLRHARATELRRQFGLDAASAVLGHAKVETTQIYAERNLDLAMRAARATG